MIGCYIAWYEIHMIIYIYICIYIYMVFQLYSPSMVFQDDPATTGWNQTTFNPPKGMNPGSPGSEPFAGFKELPRHIRSLIVYIYIYIYPLCLCISTGMSIYPRHISLNNLELKNKCPQIHLSITISLKNCRFEGTIWQLWFPYTRCGLKTQWLLIL